MDFYTQVGKLALGSRLRRLSERLTEDAAQIYALYEVEFDPKWFPVFYVLSHQPAASITEIAQQIGHSHPSVSQIVKEMGKAGLVQIEKGSDARVSVVSLSAAGRQLIPALEQQYEDVTEAVEALLAESQYDLWNAIAAVEFLLSENSLLNRVKQLRKQREGRQVEIIDYTPEFHDDFRRLNIAWIQKYFKLEPADQQALDHPDEKILNRGGHIYLARYKSEIVGTCALLKQSADRYELAKMAVAETAQGKGIGWKLGQAAIAKARELGAKTLFLESNTVLQPAIGLYQKLGFRRISGRPSPYERCNIQMELPL
jgi:GNAT superfamily N-acetyltransferase/DNA-binding MarR family transcriptional regulator